MNPASIVSVLPLLLVLGTLPAQTRPGPETSQPSDAQPEGAASRPGAGGKFGGRHGGRKGLAKGGESTATAIVLGLDWLKAHQSPDGRWVSAQKTHDIGVTALALLAFLGDGATHRNGPYAENVAKATRWLVQQQDEKGLFGTGAISDFLYDHAIATWAICEAHGLGDAAELAAPAQKAVDYLERHRNPYMVWRYQPRDNDNDTSTTVWCVMALRAAADFKLEVNPESFKLAATWFDQVTDPATGRAGYTKRGESSSRLAGDHATRFPTDKNEALTSAALLCRFFLGQAPDQVPVMHKAAATILQKPPKWSASDGSIDLYAWYFGTYALYQIGGRTWSEWSKALDAALVATQSKDGDTKGSWESEADVWGRNTGRVFTTALGVLTLEAYYRYTRLVR